MNRWLPAGIAMAGIAAIAVMAGCGGGGAGSAPTRVQLRAVIQGPATDNVATTIDLRFYRPGATGTPLAQLSVPVDRDGNGAFGLSLAPGTYDVRAKDRSHLAKRIRGWSYDPAGSPSLDFGTLLAGDVNNDNVVNQADFDYMNSVWFTNDPVADINRDGIVNGLDFSILNGNWGLTGDD